MTHHFPQIDYTYNQLLVLHSYDRVSNAGDELGLNRSDVAPIGPNWSEWPFNVNWELIWDLLMLIVLKPFYNK